jgi:hypothetical protein
VRKAMLLFVLAMMIVPFTGCSDDDEDSIDLTGTWSMDVMANTSTFKFNLTIKQSGSTITGTMIDKQTAAESTVAGTLTDTQVSLLRTIPGFVQMYTGTVSPDGKTMAGTWGNQGSGTVLGNWSAAR